MPLTPDNANEVLGALGELLETRGHRFEVVVIGGAALLLLGLVPRPTKDFDVLAIRVNGSLTYAKPLPTELISAANDIQLLYDLPDDWLNAGPADQLKDGLPDGFRDRLVAFDFGGLLVLVPSREDQICLKMHAAADPSIPNRHLDDLRRLEPNAGELMAGADFATDQRTRRDGRQRVARVVEELMNDSG